MVNTHCLTRMKTLLDLKSSYGMVGLIRSVAACQTGQSLAIGHSSGYLSLLDLRNGKIRAGFKVGNFFDIIYYTYKV